MKAQFFIISSVIIIYIITLSFQYLTGFSDIKISGVEEQQDFSYIQNIKNSFIQAFNISNYTNNGDMNKIVKDMNFNKNFLNQELLKRGISFDSKFIFFSNGFESNDFSDWSSVYGTPQILNNTSYNGINSLYSNGIEYVTKNLSGVNEVYVRTYVNFNTLPSNQNKYYFMDLYENSNQILGLGLENDNGAYKLIVYSNSFSGPWISTAVNIGNGEWHYFELYWLENGTNSILKAWYDGQLEIANQAINSGGKGKSINQYNFGATNAVGGTPDLYVDCIAISSDDVRDKCYPDEQNYFDFSMKTNDLYTETEFPYQEKIVPNPIWFNNFVNNTVAGQPTLFSLSWTDVVSLSGYIFSFDNCTGSFTNDTSWVPMSGLSNSSITVKTINSTIGCTIRWQFYANDTSGKWNISNIFSFPTTSMPPQYWLNFVNNTLAGQSTLFSLNWTTTNTGLSGYIFSTNNSGNWANNSFVKFENQTGNAIFTDGFESGNFNAWTSTSTGGSNTIEVQSTKLHTGIYAEHCYFVTNGQHCNAYKDLGAGYSTISMRVYFQVSALPSLGNEILFIGLANGTAQPWSLGIINSSGTIQGEFFRTKSVWGYGVETSFALTKTLAVNTWYSYEMDIVISSTAGSATVYLDGIQQWTEAEGNNTALGTNLSRAYAGVIGGWFGLQYPTDLYIDDVVVSTSYIGPYNSWSNVTKTLNSTVGSNVQWCVYANDTSNNWNYTSCINPFSLTTTAGNALYLNFNEAKGTIAHDLSGYGNDGTYYGETFNDGTSYSGAIPTDLHTASGVYGKALQFDGQNDYVNTTSTTLFTSTPFTISFWMNPKTVGGNNPPNTGNSTWVVSNSWNWFFEYWNSGNFEFKSCISGCSGASTTITNTNSWYYITGIYNGTHYILYVNGSFVSAGANGVGTVSYPILIGSGLCGPGTGCWDGYFNGTIDEVRIWNRSLSQAEISANMQSSLSTSRPIASYSFEEPIGATYVNDTHIWVNGTYGSALSFDGVNDYVDLGNTNSLDIYGVGAQISISAWIRKLSNVTYGPIVTKGDSQYHIQTISTGQIEWCIYDTTWRCDYSVSLADNTWYYVSGVYNGSTVFLYINGVLQSSPVSASFINHETSYGVNIGRSSEVTNRFFNGTIDEVKIWNRTLSASEILNCYQNGC